MCDCHPIVFTRKQQETLSNLKDWVRRNGAASLSTRLSRGDAEAVSVFNACKYNFKNTKLVGLETLSSLGTACHLANIEMEPAHVRSTTVYDDIDELLSHYDAGEDVYGVAFKTNHSALYARLKGRTGNKGWLDVFLLAREQRPDLQFSRFFAHMPSGVTMKEDGSIWRDGAAL